MVMHSLYCVNNGSAFFVAVVHLWKGSNRGRMAMWRCSQGGESGIVSGGSVRMVM